MDGKPTSRSEMAGSVARWANEPENRELFEAAPIPGDVGIVVSPFAQIGSKLLSTFGSEDSYRNIAWGAYRGFFDNNIQADWVHIDDIGRYTALYLPYPLVMRAEEAKRISAWVEQGGRLVSEGCPGYFGDGGAAGDVQPNLGLDEVFGVRESNVEFAPDLLDGTSFRLHGTLEVECAEYLQTYMPGSARACGLLSDGAVAAAENGFGKGRTLLMGTCSSLACMRHPGPTGGRLFAHLLRWLGVEQAVSVDNGDIKARLHSSGSGLFLWALNMSRRTQEVEITLATRLLASGIESCAWGKRSAAEASGGRIRATIPGRDALVLRIGRQG
jgi:beta-galactosidase